MNYLPILPLIVLSGAALVILLVAGFHRSHRVAAFLCTILFAAALGADIWIGQWLHSSGPRQVTRLIYVDGTGVFFMGLMIAGSIVVALLAIHYVPRMGEVKEEFYVLLTLATLGAAALTVSGHFASFFLALEVLSVSLYGLIAYNRQGMLGIEGGIKYLVLAAVSSAFLLFGMALVYYQAGTMQLSALLAPSSTGGLVATIGRGLVFVGIAFKLGVVPLHLWTPDVYQAAPAPVTAFIATVSKGAMMALLLRYASALEYTSQPALWWSIAIIAMASMAAGNLLALLQDNIKRLLAYSSIAHMGYMLVALLAGERLGYAAVAFYLVAYIVTTLGAFGVVAAIESAQSPGTSSAAYRGLFLRRPLAATVLAASLLSLAGLPLTAGFFGKFLILRASASAAQWMLGLVLVASSGVGLFYYLRVLFAMTARDQAAGAEQPYVHTAALQAAVLVLLVVLLVALGVYPAPLLWLIQACL